MPKSLIVYYSLHGSTKSIASAIAAGLSRTGFRVILHNLLDGTPPDQRKYDMLGIGSPVYYYKLPLNISDYLQSLNSLNNIPTFSFLLYGTYDFDTAKILRKALQRKNAAMLGHFQSKGADIYLGYLRQSYLFSPNHPSREEIASAESFGELMGRSTPGTFKEINSHKSQAGLMYKLERLLSQKWFVNNIYSHAFRVKREKCTSCGICQRSCPMGNIRMDRSALPIWGRNCILCLNCELKCPSKAILSSVDWFLTKALSTYNIKHALTDPSVEHKKINDELEIVSSYETQP